MSSSAPIRQVPCRGLVSHECCCHGRITSKTARGELERSEGSGRRYPATLEAKLRRHKEGLSIQNSGGHESEDNQPSTEYSVLASLFHNDHRPASPCGLLLLLVPTVLREPLFHPRGLLGMAFREGRERLRFSRKP